MSENVKKNNAEVENAGANAPQAAETASAAETPTSPKDVVAQVARGKMILETPIMSAGNEFTELHYDFKALTGVEYADAMDSDASRNADSFHLTNKQALSLFAAAAAKKTEGTDKQSIMRGLSIDDTIKAVQLTTVFFVASSRAGNRRISAE